MKRSLKIEKYISSVILYLFLTMFNHCFANQDKFETNQMVKNLVIQLNVNSPSLVLASTSNVAEDIIKRQTSVISLINMGDQALPEFLKETLNSNSKLEYEVHLASIYILGELHSCDAINAIIKDVERNVSIDSFFLDFYVIALKKILGESSEKYCGYQQKDLERLIKKAKMVQSRKGAGSDSK